MITQKQFAEDILSGECGGYDGADGARIIKNITKIALEIIEELERCIEALEGR